jgi:peptidoglycan/LPS O-acetylase OafA/YrhL
MRVSSLDGLRGIAAIAVMAFHFNVFFLPQAQLPLPLLGHAYLAVDLFFLLSGFVMAHVYGHALASNWRGHWRRFALARFARIYPSFFVTTFAVLVLARLYPIPTRLVSFSVHSLALQPPLMQQWSGLSWNYPSWSISTEAEAYLYFVLFAGFLITGRHPRLIAVCCLGILLLLNISGGSLNYYVGLPAILRTIAGFSLGVLLYRSHSRRSGSPRQWVGLISAIFAITFAVTKIDLLAVLAFACFIYYSVSADDLPTKLLNSHISVALGNWSYSIYLLHAPVHFAVMVAFAACQHPVSQLDLRSARILLFGTAFVVVALAAVHNRFIEMPLRHWLLRTGPRAQSSEPAII